MLIKTIELRMQSLSVKTRKNHQFTHTGYHTLIIPLPTLPVSMQACIRTILSSDTSPAGRAFTHTFAHRPDM